MSATTAFRAMARNNAYANATLHAAIAGIGRAGFAAARPGFFPSLRETMNHIHQVDLFYLDALEQGSVGRSVFAQPMVDDPQALAALQDATDTRLIGHCDGLGDADLSQTRQIVYTSGAVQEAVGDILLHLFQHQIHHRGQAHTMVLAAGLVPPPLDEFHLGTDRAPIAQQVHARFPL